MRLRCSHPAVAGENRSSPLRRCAGFWFSHARLRSAAALAVHHGHGTSANVAFQKQFQRPLLEPWRWWKFHLPEIQIFVHKRHAVNVLVFNGRNLSDHADLGFTYGFERAQDKFLLREQLVRGDAAAAVKAEHDGACFLRKHAAFGVPNKKNTETKLFLAGQSCFSRTALQVPRQQR